MTIQSLNDLPQTSTGVYHIKGNLTIDPSQAVPDSITNAFISDGDGAKTFIVENGDLNINSNINYGPCKNPSGVCTVRDTASLAFIVLNGNINISPKVTQMSGVYFVQQGKDTNGNLVDNGKLVSTGEANTYVPLTVFGSIYGDIQDLLSHRKFSGDPASNGGSIVIRFDERIILNTPPGLQDILQLSENQVAQ